MPQVVNVYEAKTRLSALLTAVEGGEEVVIARSGRPVARLVPFTQESGNRPGHGTARGLIRMSPDFDDPLSDLDESDPGQPGAELLP
jgi:prevent-host-death family protein